MQNKTQPPFQGSLECWNDDQKIFSPIVVSCVSEQSFAPSKSREPFLQRSGMPKVKQWTRQSPPGISPHGSGILALPTFELHGYPTPLEQIGMHHPMDAVTGPDAQVTINALKFAHTGVPSRDYGALAKRKLERSCDCLCAQVSFSPEAHSRARLPLDARVVR